MGSCLMRPIGVASIAHVAVLGTEKAQAAPSPSLAETLSWIDSTYNSHVREGGSFGYGEYVIYNADGTILKRRTEHREYHGCALTMTEEDDPTGKVAKDLYSSNVVK